MTIQARGFYADIAIDVDGVSFHAIDSHRDLCRSAVGEGETVYLTIAPEDIHLIRDPHQQRQKLIG